MLSCRLPQSGHAQTVYPVIVQPAPPTAFTRLSDLTEAAAQLWRVTFLLQDARELSVQVALLRIVGSAFSAVTTDPLRGPLLTLTPGVPITLTAVDLAPYLAPANLSVHCVGAPEFFGDGAALPEGAYIVCVEAPPLLRTGSAPLGG